MKSGCPPPPFVKKIHKIPAFFEGWLPITVETDDIYEEHQHSQNVKFSCIQIFHSLDLNVENCSTEVAHPKVVLPGFLRRRSDELDPQAL